MQSLIDHARSFHRQAAGEFSRLADGQWPQALFITCSDSRVIPSLITGAKPGELFEMRTAGNIVPPPTAFSRRPARRPPSSTPSRCWGSPTSWCAVTPTAVR